MLIEASSTEIVSEAERLEEQLERIPKAVGDLQSAMAALSACWEGAARTEFQNQVASDITEMSRLYGDLRQYIRMTDKAGKKYLLTEGKVWDRIHLLM